MPLPQAPKDAGMVHHSTIRLALLVSAFAGTAAPLSAAPAMTPAAASAPAPAPAPTPAARPIDLTDSLAAIRAEHKLPALAAMVVDASGTVLAQGVTGQRQAAAANDDAAASTPAATLADRWHLGSCTKAMTATLCAVLVRQGKLTWSSTLGDTLPDLRNQMDPAWRTVTLEQLLVHRGGAPTNLDAGGLWGRLRSHQGTPRQGRVLLAQGLLARPPAHTPGTTFEYSNAGIALAGLMAETVTATDYETLIQRELFEPLGITTAGFGAPGAVPAASVPDQPRGHHRRAKGRYRPVPPGPGSDNPQTIAPAGTVHMSLPDWSRFAALHLRGEQHGWTVGTRKLLLADDFVTLHTPVRDPDDAAATGGFAMGWAFSAAGAGKPGLLSHAGSNTMWLCQVVLDRAAGRAILISCNAAGPDADKAVRAATAAAHKATTTNAQGN